MKKTLSGREGYSKLNGTQENKDKTLELSMNAQSDVLGILSDTNLFSKVEIFEAEEKLSGNTPAVRVNIAEKEELVCAPDIKCYVNDDEFFWVDVKDKPQRYFYPDTGCDIHQYMSYYKINRFRNEPVLLFFRDGSWKSLESGWKKLPSYKQEDFKMRWNMFAPNEKSFWYGHWFDVLCNYDEGLKYPICRSEHTRDMPMDICYMHVGEMVAYADKESFMDLLRDFQNHTKAPDFKIRHITLGVIEDISRMDERIGEIFKI